MGGGGAGRFRSHGCTRASLTASCPALRAHRTPTHAALAHTTHTQHHAHRTCTHAQAHRSKPLSLPLRRGAPPGARPCPASGQRGSRDSGARGPGTRRAAADSGRGCPAPTRKGSGAGRKGQGGVTRRDPPPHPRSPAALLRPPPAGSPPAPPPAARVRGGGAGCARARGRGAAVGSAGNPRGPATGGRRGGSSGAGLQGAPRSRGRGLGRGGGAARPARKRSRPRVSGRSRGVWRLVLARRTGTALSRLSPASPLSCPAAGGGRELAGEVSSWPVGFACLLGALGGEESSSSLVHGRAGHRKVSYQLGDGGGPSASLLTGWDDLKVPEVSPASRAPGFPSSHPLSCSGGPWAGGRGDLAVPPPARWASRRHPRGLPALQLRSRRTVEPRSQRNRVRVLAGHRGVSIRPRASANTPEGRPGQEYPWNRTSDSGVSTSLSHFRSSPELGVVTVPRPDRYGPSNQGQRCADFFV